MALRRDYRLDAPLDDVRRRLREHLTRASVDRIGDASREELHLDLDGDRFAVFLGSGEATRPASCIRGELEETGGSLRLKVQTSLARLRPDSVRESKRELAEWAAVIGGASAVAFVLGLLGGADLLGALARWAVITALVVGARLFRRVVRRRRDQAELVSLVEGAVGPVLALPEGSPYRAKR